MKMIFATKGVNFHRRVNWNAFGVVVSLLEMGFHSINTFCDGAEVLNLFLQLKFLFFVLHSLSKIHTTSQSSQLSSCEIKYFYLFAFTTTTMIFSLSCVVVQSTLYLACLEYIEHFSLLFWKFIETLRSTDHVCGILNEGKSSVTLYI